VPRDASTVLSVKGAAHIYRRAPSQRHTANFDCVNVGTAERPVYHGGGWLPAPLTKATCVLTPHIYATEHSSANCALSCDELLVCNDAPDLVVTALQPFHSVLDTECFAGLLPGKCLTIGFACLNGGGVFSSPGSRSLGKAPEVEPKRRKSDEKGREDEGKAGTILMTEAPRVVVVETVSEEEAKFRWGRGENALPRD
jgi:hypothetical protein